jgi:hypothetical protein
MYRRHATGEQFTLRQIVAMMVPFITELAERHADGEYWFVYPSAVVFDAAGLSLDTRLAQRPPEDHHDRACLAPERRASQSPGDARASVFACGAMLYELATQAIVGPGMRRPSELVRGMSEQFEILLGKALVTDPNHRPADLAALALALHHCSPMASIPPPAADESHLDHGSDFEVDVSLSMLPPAPGGGYSAIPRAPALPTLASLDGPPPSQGGVPAPAASSTEQLSELKARLEADPRPRYVVIKDGMDHGPFTAVELLQQIATGSFVTDHVLRDTLGMDEMPIGEWEEFMPFAEHARRNIDLKVERKAFDAKVEKETRSTQNKALIGISALVLAAAAFAGWWFRIRATDDVRVGVSEDEAQAIDIEGGFGKDSKTGGARWSGGKSGGPAPAGGYPTVGGGGSCEAAAAAYVENYDKSAPPDLSAGAYAGVLSRGTYLNACGVPPSMGVSICAAVQNGRAVGVTVRTDPASGGIAGCVRGAVFGMSFPAHPRLDVTRTHFKPE